MTFPDLAAESSYNMQHHVGVVGNNQNTINGTCLLLQLHLNGSKSLMFALLFLDLQFVSINKMHSLVKKERRAQGCNTFIKSQSTSMAQVLTGQNG